MKVRPLDEVDIDSCSKILGTLPEWFGIAAANQAYISSLRQLPGAVAEIDGEVVGFVAITHHTEGSAEIHIIAVDRGHHSQGAGKALVGWVEKWCMERGIRWLHVKTRGPSTPDPDYERTRRFYLSVGFEPLFESLTLWGPANAALIMVKHIRR